MSAGVLSTVYNEVDNAKMHDNRFLFQPRGAGTAWTFRMRTPEILIGKANPRTRQPYGPEIREGLGGTRSLPEARKLRDLRLGEIRAEEARARLAMNGDMGSALLQAEHYRRIDDEDYREAVEFGIQLEAEKIAKSAGERRGYRWSKVAKGEATPLKATYEKYLEEDGAALSQSTRNNLATAVTEFLAFTDSDVTMEEVDRRKVAEFLTHLRAKKGPKAPEGQGPATIRKKVSQLAGIWRWASKRGFLPYSTQTPWDDQAPSRKAVRAAQRKRRPFTPEEARQIFDKAPLGTTVGDAARVALLTGVRLEEVASLEAPQVDPEARFYEITKGKSVNAARIVPLVDEAQAIIKRRLDAANGGALFPELNVRKSTGRRGGALSQAFTRLRRDTLGGETDGALAHHSFRHTWRTEARRAGVDLDVIHALGGWSSKTGTDRPYDHGLEVEQYRKEQQRVADRLRERGYLATQGS